MAAGWHQQATLASYFKSVFLEIQNVRFGKIFQNPVTNFKKTCAIAVKGKHTLIKQSSMLNFHKLL